jgi:hypothetical protein
MMENVLADVRDLRYVKPWSRTPYNNQYNLICDKHKVLRALLKGDFL